MDTSSLMLSAKRHRIFLIALLGGVLIRCVVVWAYRPALLYNDSYGYLRDAEHPHLSQLRPIGYSLLMWPYRQVDSAIQPIVVFQHLLGLTLAVLCYTFLVRRGLPGWGATLATLPVLFDPLQLVLEHYVLADVSFELLLAGACLLLAWKPRPGPWAVALAGVAVSASALVRGAGTFVLVVFILGVVCLRLGWVKVVLFVVAAAVPLVAYATAYHATWGTYALSQGGPRFLYARLAPIVRCHDPQLQLPAYEKELCPAQPVAERRDSDYYMWARPNRKFRVNPPPGISKFRAVSDFDKRVVRAQPWAFARVTMGAFLDGFSPSRTTKVPGHPARNWLFQNHYWMRRHVWHPTGDRGPASFLKKYRQVLWAPGPLLGALVVVAAIAMLGFGRARRSGHRVAIGLFTGSCLVTLLTGAALSGFSWRYQLPQLALVPVAGALAIAALVSGPTWGPPAPPPPLRLLDRSSSWLAARVPRLRPAHERGILPVLLGVLAGSVSGIVLGAMAVWSGWFRPESGALVALVAGVIVVICLVGAHRRAATDDSDEVGSHPDPASTAARSG